MMRAAVLLLVGLTAAASVSTPIKKVLILLNDMQQQLSKEADEDEATYDKMMCFCETNEKDKTKMIQDAEQRIAELTTLIETTAATSARLTQEITNHEEDLAKSQKSLDTATAIRKKQAEEFHGEEKEMLESIKALGAAIVVLSKHHPGGAAFVDRSAVEAIAKLAREQLQTHLSLLRGVVTPKQRRMISAFGQQDSKPTFMQAPNYQAGSGEIFGILRQMKETFESNLADSQKDELSNKKAYEDLKGAKMEEISATAAALEQKKVQLAEADETNAQSKEDIVDTQASLGIDDQFLLQVKEKCEKTRQEWDIRSKARQDEISAIVEAVSILSSDEARDNFGKTFTPASLIQREVRHQGKTLRAEAGAVLAAAAEHSQNPKMAALAVSVNLDAFTKVKQAIDEMVAELIKEKQDEIMHRDTCTTELNDNELTLEREERNKAGLDSKIEGLENDITELKGTIETLNAEIAEMQLQIKRSGEDRELANKDFQGIIADQRETQRLLQKAISVLKAVYARKATALVQAPTPLPDIPEGFSTPYKQSGAGVGVVALLEQILSDAVATEKEVVGDEQTEQTAYENFVKTSNKAINSKRQGLIDKGEDKAKAEQDLTIAGEDRRSSVTELETLTNTAGALHMSCDFIMKNFEVRQEARDQEVEALRQAKAILSGMESD